MIDPTPNNPNDNTHKSSSYEDPETLDLSSIESQVIKLLSFRIQKEETDHPLLTLFIDRSNSEFEAFSSRMSSLLLDGTKNQILKFNYVKEDQAFELTDYNYWDVHNRCALEFIQISNLQSAFIEGFPQHLSKLQEGIRYLRSGLNMRDRMDDILEKRYESRYGLRGWEDFPIDDYLTTIAFGDLLAEAQLSGSSTFRAGVSSPCIEVHDNGFGRDGWIRLRSTVQVEYIDPNDAEIIREIAASEKKEALLDELKLHNIPSSLLETYPPPQLLGFANLIQEYWNMLETYTQMYPGCPLTEDEEMHFEQLRVAGVHPDIFRGHREYISWRNRYHNIRPIHIFEYTKAVKGIAEFSPSWPHDEFENAAPIPMKLVHDLFSAPVANWRGSSATFTADGEHLSIIFRNDTDAQSLAMTVTRPISFLLETETSQKLTSVEFTLSEKSRNGAEIHTLYVEDSISARLLYQLMLYHLQGGRTTSVPVPSMSD